MILHCSYEEMVALREGARVLLAHGEALEPCAVLAPPADRDRVEELVPRLAGDVAIDTLSEQRGVESAIAAIVACLRSEMESLVVAHHPADEGAVAAYFDFAHALAVLGRLRLMGAEMEALIEVVTGSPADDEIAARFVFPD